jgi:hypothetical protein
MDTRPWLAVSNAQALRFFFEHLRDVTEDAAARFGVSDVSACGMAHLSCVLADACIHDPARTGTQVGALAAFRQAPPGTCRKYHAWAWRDATLTGRQVHDASSAAHR